MQHHLIKVTEAQKLLRVSKKKMAALLAEGVIHFISDPLDKRLKLVAVEDIEKLLSQAYKKAA